jgi:hypothetical protein
MGRHEPAHPGPGGRKPPASRVLRAADSHPAGSERPQGREACACHRPGGTVTGPDPRGTQHGMTGRIRPRQGRNNDAPYVQDRRRRRSRRVRVLAGALARTCQGSGRSGSGANSVKIVVTPASDSGNPGVRAGHGSAAKRCRESCWPVSRTSCQSHFVLTLDTDIQERRTLPVSCSRGYVARLPVPP